MADNAFNSGNTGVSGMFTQGTAVPADKVNFSIQAGSDAASLFSGDAIACYAAGTRIAVPEGEKRIDDLRIGDLVMTTTGTAKPIKWIGRRDYTAAVAAANAHVRPILVRQDAIAPGMPHRDLTVSPAHALLIDDVLVPAASLVNGVTILRNDELAAVSYLHIELADHDVVFAEGQPAETFVDDASRQMFDNADEYHTLYGAERSAPVLASRLQDGLQLEAIRRRLIARAGLPAPVAGTGKLRGHVERLDDGMLKGWVLDTTAPSVPVELEVTVDGEVVATAIANRYRADLDFHGVAGGCAGFSIAMPASVTSLGQVIVRRAADGVKVAMPQVALAV